MSKMSEVAARVQGAPDQLTRETLLAEVADSLSMLELFDWLEGLGCPVDPTTFERLSTVGDVLDFADMLSGTASVGTAPRDALTGRFVSLRAPAPPDYPVLYDMTHSNENLLQFRAGATVTRPEAFADALWQGVLTQLVITSVDGTEVVGLASVYGADLRSGTAFFSLIVDRRARGRGWAGESLQIFLRYVFDHWPLRRLYAEVTDVTLAQFRQVVERELFTHEATLTDHVLSGGEYRSVHYLVCTPESFTAWCDQLSR